MSELYEEVREALTELATEEAYEKMIDPEYSKVIIQMAKEIAFALAKADAEEDEDPEELGEIIFEELEKMFSSEEQLRELATQSAATKYVTKREAKAFLDGYLSALGPDQELEPSQLKLLKEAHKEFLNKCQKAYDLIDELLSALVGIAKREGVEKVVTIERRNTIIKALIPDPEEYIDIYTISWKAAQEFFNQIQEALFDEPEIEEIGKTMFDAIKNAVSSIYDDLLKHEADTIYH